MAFGMPVLTSRMRSRHKVARSNDSSRAGCGPGGPRLAIVETSPGIVPHGVLLLPPLQATARAPQMIATCFYIQGTSEHHLTILFRAIRTSQPEPFQNPHFPT